MRRVPIVALAVTLTLLAASCSGGAERSGEPQSRELPREIVLASRLQPFAACDELLGHLQAEALERVGPYGLEDGMYAFDTVTGGELGMEEDASGSAEASSPRADGEARAQPGEDFSTTNVQEAGIDEPDIVKTDGERIFAVAGGRLHAVEVSDGSPQLVDSLDLPDGFNHQLLLVGNRLLVLTDGYVYTQEAALAEDIIAPPGETSELVLSLVDVSDAADLQVIERLTVDGHSVSAREVDGQVHVVVSSLAPGLEFTYPGAGTIPDVHVPGQNTLETSEAEAETHNRDVIERSTLDDWLPGYRLEQIAGDGSSTSGGLSDCGAIHQPPEFSGFGSLTVLTLEPAAGLDPEQSTAVLTNGEIVYASPERLYVATNEWFDPVTFDKQRVAPDFDQTTKIHAFDISGDDGAEYLVSGEVRGRLLRQFSMSEHDGFLRVATTDGSSWSSSSESFVTVLAEQDDDLAEVGQVGDLGRGEQIHSVRFVGDVGYVVTFRQTDPLYTIDLSDPTSPTVLGELKILGYSAYLHPIDDDLLIGVGQDATEEGRRLGLQVSLFDVSDLRDPRRIDQLTLGDGESAVEFDHHAFLYWAPTGLTVVPVDRYYGSGPSSVALALEIDRADGITERAELAHPGTDVAVPSPGRSDDQLESMPPVPELSPTILRSLVIGDTLFTLSDAGLMANDLDTLEDEAWILFTS